MPTSILLTATDCRQAVRDAERFYRLRDSSVDPVDLTAGEQLSDLRMDFESLLPKLSDRQRMAVVLFDEGNSIPELPAAMGLEYRPAYNLLKKALKRLGRWM